MKKQKRPEISQEKWDKFVDKLAKDVKERALKDGYTEEEAEEIIRCFL